VEKISGARLNQMNCGSREVPGFSDQSNCGVQTLKGHIYPRRTCAGANLREALLPRNSRSRPTDTLRIWCPPGHGCKSDGVGSAFPDLSYGTFENAVLSNAKVSGASLYAVNLRNAQLLRTDLSRTDMRDTKLEHAVLSFANLRAGGSCPPQSWGKRT